MYGVQASVSTLLTAVGLSRRPRLLADLVPLPVRRGPGASHARQAGGLQFVEERRFAGLQVLGAAARHPVVARLILPGVQIDLPAAGVGVRPVSGVAVVLRRGP